MKNIIFATGIECSYPTVQGGIRRDQLEETKHYEHWRQDFQLCLDTGAKVVRYGPPYHRMHLGPHKYDWSFTDEVLPVMRQMGLTPIMDLCHFGVPIGPATSKTKIGRSCSQISPAPLPSAIHGSSSTRL